MQVEIDPDTLPPTVVPAAEIKAKPDGEPLVDSDWGFAEQCQALIARKRYTDG